MKTLVKVSSHIYREVEIDEVSLDPAITVNSRSNMDDRSLAAIDGEIRDHQVRTSNQGNAPTQAHEAKRGGRDGSRNASTVTATGTATVGPTAEHRAGPDDPAGRH
jgi:hypothetical protein